MTHYTKLFAAAIVAVMITGTTAFAGNVMVKLEGMGHPDDYGFGSHGLYLGDDWGSMNGSTKNWKWEKPDVLLTIFDGSGTEAAGDAQITGTMTRKYNSEVWGFTIDLKGLKQAGSDDDAVFDMSMLQGANEGYDWAELMLTLHYDGQSIVPRDDWVGLAMPDIGHVNVAEIRTDETGHIRFDAWYQHVLETELKWVKDWYKNHYGQWRYNWVQEEVIDYDDPDYDGHKYYNVGDTKAWGWLMPPDDTPEIPTPAALPAGLALLGLAAARRRNRK